MAVKVKEGPDTLRYRDRLTQRCTTLFYGLDKIFLSSNYFFFLQKKKRKQNHICLCGCTMQFSRANKNILLI
jgi:hypothetical protein